MTCRILVAEDSATQAEELRAVLEREDAYQVSVARSGEEALRRAESADFDLVLSDIVMPGIDGYELCRKMKALLPDVPVILVTGLTDPMDIVRGLEAGADNYITKPYDPEHLLARVRRVVDNRTLRSGVRTSMGVKITFLGNAFTINSDREQILDLLLSSVEDTVRMNRQLEEHQLELTEAHAKLELYAIAQAREARRSTERYHTLMQNAGDAIFVLDRDGAVVEANARAADLLARPLQQALHRPLAEILGAEGAAALLADGGENSDQEATSDLLLRHPERGPVWVELSSSTIRLEDETLTLVIARDVTERRRAEDTLRATLVELQESEDKLRTIFKASPAAIVLLDRELRVREWNDAAEAIFGWSREEAVGQLLPLVDREHWERETVPLRDRILLGSSVTGLEVRRRRRDGSPVDLSLSAAPLRGADGEINAIVGMITDITDRKQKEEELRQAQRLEAIGRLTGGVAHDFNNILATILGGTQSLLLGELPERETEVRRELEEIDKAAQRATTLTRQLLAFSRKQVLQPKVLDLNALLRDMHGMLRRVIGEGIELRLELAGEIGHIRADPGQVQQVIMNLVVNARDAMARGGVITLRTGDGREEAGPGGELRRCVLLIVEDSGEGMSDEVREQIFEPFFTTKDDAHGTGLGLSTVYGIVRQSGGSITVESALGIGSTFRILLPSVNEDVDVDPEPAVPIATDGSETILLVEDDRAVRKITSRILRKHGYTVLEASSGAEALSLLEEHEGTVHLLVTDLMMPKMSGRELAERVGRERRHLPVLYMSGYSEDSILEDGLPPRDMPLLEKPFAPDVLVSRIRELLDRHS